MMEALRLRCVTSPVPLLSFTNYSLLIPTKALLVIGMMSQWVKDLAAQFHDLSSILRIHMKKGENKLLKVVFWRLHMIYNSNTQSE